MRGGLPSACVIGLLFLMCPRTGVAQTFEVAPFGGYRFGGDLFEDITGTPLDIDGAPSFGAVFDLFVDRGMTASFLYSHQEALVDLPPQPGGAAQRARLSIDHWHVGGSQGFGTGVVRPFYAGTVGLTRFGGAHDSEIRFSVAGGGGVKLMPSRHVGVRLDGRVYAVFVDGETLGGICAGGCVVRVSVSVVWQAEFTAGLVLSF